MKHGVREIEHPHRHWLIEYDERCAKAHSLVVRQTKADALDDAAPAAFAGRATLSSSEEEHFLISAFSQRTYPIVQPKPIAATMRAETVGEMTTRNEGECALRTISRQLGAPTAVDIVLLVPLT